MLRGARITTKIWHEFLDDFVNNAELIASIKAQSPRQQPACYNPEVAEASGSASLLACEQLLLDRLRH